MHLCFALQRKIEKCCELYWGFREEEKNNSPKKMGGYELKPTDSIIYSMHRTQEHALAREMM